MADYWTPTMVCNQAIMACGISNMVIGDIEDGSEASKVCLMAYTMCLEQLLRGAHWDFARRETPMNLVADASGQTPSVGTLVPAGFLYSYSYPTDCVKVRFVPAFGDTLPPVPAGNIQPPDASAPLMTGLTTPAFVGQRQVPSRFLIASDANNIPEGAANDQLGISPIGMNVICSNIQRARVVYTLNATYPNLWDPQFRSALVSYIASEVCLPLHRDKKFGLMMQSRKIGEAQSKIQQARVSNGNEGWANSDLAVDWMRARVVGYGRGGYGGGNWGGGPGYLFGGWDQCFFTGNSSAY